MELLELQDCAEPLVARASKVNKGRLGNKVLLGLAHLEPQALRVSKARLGHKAQLEWLALAELQD
jgi:hypothetical protein